MPSQNRGSQRPNYPRVSDKQLAEYLQAPGAFATRGEVRALAHDLYELRAAVREAERRMAVAIPAKLHGPVRSGWSIGRRQFRAILRDATEGVMGDA